MGDEQDNLLTAGPGWGLGHAGRAGRVRGATGGAVARGWGQAGGNGQGWWLGEGLGVCPHEDSGSEQEGATGSGLWGQTGTVARGVLVVHPRGNGAWGMAGGATGGTGGLGWGQAGTVARGGLQCCWHCPCLCSRSGDREGTAWWGQDRTQGVPKCFQSAFNARGWGRGFSRIHSGDEQGAGGAVAAPHQRAPAGQEPPGNAMTTATKPATGRGSRPGRGRGERRGRAGAAATPWPCR